MEPYCSYIKFGLDMITALSYYPAFEHTTSSTLSE